MTLLEQANEDITIIDYINHPPSVDTISELVLLLGIKPEKLVRKNENLYQSQFSNLQLSDFEWIELLAKNPTLIERPIVVKKGKAIIGRPPKLVLTIL